MMTNAADRQNDLQRIKAQRQAGELDTTAYYKALLGVLADLIQNLLEEEISETEAKKQTPLLLVFLEEQIQKFADRGG